MDLELRSIAPEEYEAFHHALAMAFGFEVRREDIEHWASHMEYDRTVCAFEGGELVGASATISQRLAVPGAIVAAGGLTAVGVLPSHRRRGVLTEMMRRHLAQVKERSEVVSNLWAAEWPIYGRFGYGRATVSADFTIEIRHGRFAEPLAAAGRVRIIDLEEARKSLPAIFAKAFGRPGMVERTTETWEAEHFWDPEHSRHGFTSARFAVYEEEGNALGYVGYRTKEDWDGRNPAGTTRVDELVAQSPEAYQALWSFVFGIDLTTSVRASVRPIDEPLVWMLEDPRRLRRELHDGLWLRPVDISRALSARRYRTEGRVVLEVRDDFLPELSGRYLLEGSPEGAVCTATDRAADLRLGTGELGAVYLGGASVAELARAGRIRGDEQAVRRGDALFGWDEPPWCPDVF